jgi:hypothetical protein
MIDLPFHALLPFPMTDPADRAPRWLALSMMPALALVFWAAFRLAPTATGQRIGRRMFKRAPEAVTSPEEFDRYRKTYDAIVLGVVMLFLGFHAAVLAMAWEAPHVAARIVPAVLGGSLVLMGNVMPRLRPNWVAGLRTQRLLENPQLWRSAHRVFGAAFVVSGAATILAAVVVPQYGLLVAIVSVLASCVVGFVASTRHGNTATHAALLGLGLLCTSASATPAQAPPDAQSSLEVIAPATVAESPFTSVRRSRR